MKVKFLFESIPISLDSEKAEIEICNLHIHSSECQAGDLFVAIPGYTVDSHQFIPELVQNHVYILANESYRPTLESTLTSKDIDSYVFFVQDTKECLPYVSKNYFESPDQSMFIVGVTGTNGKTSSTYLLKHILEAGGEKVGIIGTIQHMIGDTVIKSINTTPNAFELYSLLHQMKNAGCTAVAMEISSHALSLHRVQGLDLDIAIFTSFSQDHLDFHSSLEEYFEAKLKIFDLLGRSKKKSKHAFIQAQIPFWDKIETRLQQYHLEYTPYQITNSLDPHFQGIQGLITYQSFVYQNIMVQTPLISWVQKMTMLGAFSAENMLACVGVGCFRNISSASMSPAIESVRVNGRFDNISPSPLLGIFIDYAHTPDAIGKSLASVRQLNPKKIIALFGAGGDRDKSKRKDMARKGYQYSDILILTSCNPRSENPRDIISDLASGVPDFFKKTPYYFEITLRKKAIQKALSLAEEGTAIVILGKGHETTQKFKYKSIPFSDYTVVQEFLPETLRKLEGNALG